jgi:CCR4-NOT transcriptional regulation complex NOT5 subunit
MVFTEQGVAMLSSVLNSDRAITVNIQIIRVFTRMRQMLETHKEILRKIEMLQKKDIDQDEQIAIIFNCLNELQQAHEEEEDFKKRRRIGFKRQKDS